MLLDREFDRSLLLDRVAALTGITDREHVERAVEATMEVLAEQELAPAFDEAGFYHEISRREGTALGFAVEHAQVVLSVLSDLVGDEARRRMIHKLPAEMEALLQPPVRERGISHHSHPGLGHTLASAHAGSDHPLAIARADRAHAHSIARSDNPHGDSKLSTTHGVKKHPSLADDRPGSERPLVDERED